MSAGRSISSRVNDHLVAALVRTKDIRRTDCPTCLGKRVIVQISAEMHDRWAHELAAAHGAPVSVIHTYGEFRVQQLPHLAEGAFQVRACWDCTELPTIPDDPEAIERFLT